MLNAPWRRRLSAGAAALAVALVGSGCGTRTSDKELAALLNTASESPVPATSEAAGAEPGSPLTEPLTDGSGTAGEAPLAGRGPDSPAAPAGGAASPTAGSGAPSAGTRTASGRATSAPGPGSARSGSAARAAGAQPGAAEGGKSGAAAATPPSGAPQGCSGAAPPVIIGSVGSYSGVLGSLLAGGVKGVQAWAAAQNANGGLRCHPVKYVVADDGGDAARNQSLVRRLVEQDKVVAFVYNGAPLTAQASVGYLNEKQVPEIGQEGGHMFTYESPMTFPIGAAAIPIQRLTLTGGARVTVPAGRTKAAIITCQETDYCNVADKTYKEQAPAVGYQVVYTAKASFTQPDFTSICISAQNAGANVLLMATDANSHQRLMANCAKVNYRPTDVMTTIQMSTTFKDDPNLDGAVIVSNNLPWFLSQHPAVAEFGAAMKKHAPGEEINATSMNGWAAAKAFETAMQTVGAGQAVTSKDVLAGLYALDGNELGGLVAPLRFTPGKPAKPVACGWAVVVSKSQFQSDGQRFCVKGLEP